MSERMPDLGGSYPFFERNTEILETKGEKRHECDPTDPRCEAKVSKKTLQQGYLDGMYSLEGRRISDPSKKESPTIIETTIQCQGCDILHQFQSEGMGFAPSNNSERQVEAFLQNNCAKLLARGYKPGQIPKDRLPR